MAKFDVYFFLLTTVGRRSFVDAPISETVLLAAHHRRRQLSPSSIGGVVSARRPIIFAQAEKRDFIIRRFFLFCLAEWFCLLACLFTCSLAAWLVRV